MGEIVGLENLFDNSEHITTAIVDTDCILLEVPVSYFRSVAENHLSLEILAKKEEVFYKIKTLSKRDLIGKEEFFFQLRSFKSLCIHNML